MALKITQVKGLVGTKPNHRKNIEALGLKRIGHTVVKQDTPIIRGMVQKVRHLVTVEEVAGE
ncbi:MULTISPECIES: 50S ribosomal protein L30 [Corynebacterium]|uniref:Large ribosomal subunit protein uL30 n=1 Tax=Corynebacterium singulare TaxID=161899 RepID=A0A0B6EYM9_9CORY|nr:MULTISPECIES: 50S ribosomal protein L30 [Corynebacterium]AJI78034.1 ribosomal protein L30, bacterial/organelle [Corynebacterium singulare]MCG7276349.1 50S ribosomal protein L30 [Corynebacterium singulare]MCQ9676005.1 50S ribosomal protein L30 [Corynebacterium sp. BF-R-2]MDO5032329.1 50S ribosomal protein L30 [Corynebacterium sp.]OFT60071.1 50S ribosomal protein L30 [Corynebacterium sp. HMSC05E07]